MTLPTNPSLAFMLRNPQLYGKLYGNPDSPSQSPESERSVRDGSLAASEAPQGGSGRVSIRIVSFRKRLCDPDNLCGKAFVDCLRYSGIIPDDRPEDIDYQVTQTKVRTSEDERTEITIT